MAFHSVVGRLPRNIAGSTPQQLATAVGIAARSNGSKQKINIDKLVKNNRNLVDSNGRLSEQAVSQITQEYGGTYSEFIKSLKSLGKKYDGDYSRLI